MRRLHAPVGHSHQHPHPLLSLACQELGLDRPRIVPTSPGHLAHLIRGPTSNRFAEVITNRQSESEEYSYEQVIVTVLVRDLDYRAIFRGIAHLEQGREPRINASVYFISARRTVVFFLYDDRGCLVFADRAEQLRPLSLNRRSWLVDPDRLDREQMFVSRTATELP